MLVMKAMIMPTPGDLAEFRKAFISGGRERQKPGGGRERRQSEAAARMVSGRNEGRCQFVALETLGPVADAELQAEIHADPDEKHEEGNRNGVEGTRPWRAPARPLSRAQ